jgi:NAD(P)-dependent dehydrogenase (short-subunit alcohol dehydrogenase family)
MDFRGKIALVTGAATGLGSATAKLLAKNGAFVYCADINEAKGVGTVDDIIKNGGSAQFEYCDVCDEKAIDTLILKIIHEKHCLDIAVNNAGIGGKWLPTHKYPSDNFKNVLDVNVMGVFYGMRAQINAMLNNNNIGGSIVNVSSVGGLLGFPNNIAYSASKHAVIGLTKTAALEYATKNIRVNAVCPVFTRTPLVESIFDHDPTLEEKLAKSIPMKRYGEPSEVAATILWLLSDAASYITGSTIPIDGGFTAG